MAAVHANNRTMKLEWREVWDQLWDRLAAKIRSCGVKFLAGDFNMSLTEVVKRLKNRDIKCDCVAWYPWMHATEKQKGLAFLRNGRMHTRIF